MLVLLLESEGCPVRLELPADRVGQERPADRVHEASSSQLLHQLLLLHQRLSILRSICSRIIETTGQEEILTILVDLLLLCKKLLLVLLMHLRLLQLWCGGSCKSGNVWLSDCVNLLLLLLLMLREHVLDGLLLVDN